MQERTESRGESRGVAGLGQLPAFELPRATGGGWRSWEQRGRHNWVIWLAGASPDRGDVRHAAAHQAELGDELAELILIVRGAWEPSDAGAESPGPVLVDADGRLHARLGAGGPTLLVTDRHGTIYWRTRIEDFRADFAEALSWLEYLNILEPECGSCVPAWPTE